MSYIFLSHPISSSTPGFGGHLHFATEMRKSLACGDSCNQQVWTIDNHVGTHLDAPLHFYQNARSVDSYTAMDWVFAKVGLCDLSVQDGQMIGANDLDLATAPQDCELLLIRTGFELKRTEKVYWENNPGLTPELADTLREMFPKLRAIGFDFISLTAYQNRPLGRLAHQAFLRPERPLVIIEDMKLSGLKGIPQEVIISPIRVEGADGAPCTVFARLK